MAPAPASSEQVEGLDEEFLYHLNLGANLLAKAELEGARGALARALELRPRDVSVLGLLGQSLYRLGRFDEAATTYARLALENPAEPAAHVNLGLASLKAKRHEEAIRHLERALQLSPDHRKAMAYVGLAWFERGDIARAREWFRRAGSDQMVARCDETLAVARPPPAVPAAAPVRQVEVTREPASGAPGEGDGAATLAAFGAGRRTPSPQGGGTFALERGLFSVTLSGRDVLACAEGLLAVRGPVRLVPEMKRFRGRATEKPFGDGARRMLRASGEGQLLYRAGPGHLEVLHLRDESGYFREEVVFAFEGSVAFENGRVTSSPGKDLSLVNLRGRGRMLLATAGEIVALEVRRGEPLRVPVEALVGWSGGLTPRIGPLAEAAPGRARVAAPALVMELAGDGTVFLDGGAA